MADNTVRQFKAEAEALENQLEEAEALYARPATCYSVT